MKTLPRPRPAALVVDDDDISLLLIREALRKVGLSGISSWQVL